MKKILIIFLILPIFGFGQTLGCTDSTALNYNPNATVDDGSCLYCYSSASIGVDTISVCDSVLISTDTIINGSYFWSTSNIIPPSSNPSIGDYYQGGVVFWINPNDSSQGLICDISDLGGVEFGCFGTLITGADGTAIGTGLQNTIDIVNSNCNTIRICIL